MLCGGDHAKIFLAWFLRLGGPPPLTLGGNKDPTLVPPLPVSSSNPPLPLCTLSALSRGGSGQHRLCAPAPNSVSALVRYSQQRRCERCPGAYIEGCRCLRRQWPWDSVHATAFPVSSTPSPSLSPHLGYPLLSMTKRQTVLGVCTHSKKVSY